MKRLVSVFVLVLFAFRTLMFPEINDNSLLKNNIDDEKATYVVKELSQNVTLMRNTFKNNKREMYDSKSTLRIAISDELSEAEIIFEYKGIVNKAPLKGEYNEVDLGDYKGYVATYEGIIGTGYENKSVVSTNKNTPVILDVIFTDNDMFAVVTLGYVTETSTPNILFYGEYSEVIGKISQMHSEDVEKEKESDNTDIEPYYRTVDANYEYQGSVDTKLGGKKVGTLSVFHANELRNQDSMSVCAKVNTNSANVKTYIKNDLGYNSNVITAYADKFAISICGNSKLHAFTGAYEPDNNVTTITIPVPIYLGSVVRVQTFNYTITTSKTTLKRSPYDNNSPNQLPNSRLEWEMYKLNGWNPDTFEGGVETKKGMLANAMYIYEGTVNNTFVVSMNFSASIRYEYGVMIMGNMSTLHISTNKMSKTTYVRIKP